MSPTLLFFLWQLFGPNDPIVVSRETTYITAPLRSNGLPDYEQYLLEQSRQGITSENNAAVLLWQALWPGELEPSQYRAMCDELGLESIPSRSNALELCDANEFQDRLKSWLASNTNATVDDAYLNQLLRQASSRPWKTNDIPLLAQWLHDNKKPLDLAVKASLRTRYYTPSPSLIDDKHDMLIEVLLPGVQGVRSAARSLAIRAMWHLGEERTAEAWQDLIAIHRLSRLVGQSWSLVEKLASLSIAAVAQEGTTALLGRKDLTIQQARLVQHDLNSLSDFTKMIEGFESDRLMLLDSLVHTHFGRSPELRDPLLLASDWNVALRRANEWHDRIAHAVTLTNYTDRKNAIDRIEEDIRNQEEPKAKRRTIGVLLNSQQRSEVFAAIFISLMMPAADVAMRSQDQANTFLELTQLAAALAVYRAEHGNYPDRLDQLVPNILSELPNDLYHAKPFIYRRDANGYLLYCVGENGTDDGGSNKIQSVLAGRMLDEVPFDDRPDQIDQIPAGADDLSIRLPRPTFKLPTPPVNQP